MKCEEVGKTGQVREEMGAEIATRSQGLRDNPFDDEVEIDVNANFDFPAQ